MADCFLMKSGSANTGGELSFTFKKENLLLDATLYSSNFTINYDNDNNKVTITVPDNLSVSWYQIFKPITFKLNTMYKLTVTNLGYGRIGFSSTSSDPDKSGIRTNACIFSILSPNANDNSLVAKGIENSIYFTTQAASATSSFEQTGSFWFCSDTLYNNERKGYTFEIVLQEQENFTVNE